MSLADQLAELSDVELTTLLIRYALGIDLDAPIADSTGELHKPRYRPRPATVTGWRYSWTPLRDGDYRVTATRWSADVAERWSRKVTTLRAGWHAMADGAVLPRQVEGSKDAFRAWIILGRTCDRPQFDRGHRV